MTITIGASIHSKKIIPPIINTNISIIIPARIRKLLIIAPMILEKELDTNASAHLLTLNPLPYDQEYFLHGANNVFNNKGMEKRYE